MPTDATRWTCPPYSVAAADAIAAELGLSRTVASILVRRGYPTPHAARGFLDAADRHDPSAFGAMAEVCVLVLRHVRNGTRIVVHGDYDVDGVASTATVVRALRALGASPAWHLPSRLEEGYGLADATIEGLTERDTGLLITVDCAITAVDQVARARARGIDVVVTDHHRPGDQLPDCPILHPGLGGYPFPDLCATGVAYKLSLALRAAAGLDPLGADEDLDLVALATICDVVPLTGENRRLVVEGLRALTRTRKPGLRALMRVAALDPGEVDARAVGFRLGPRLNAAGRLRRADAALELLMTDDEHRAGEVADELDLLNRDRRDTETRMLFAAEAARSEQADAPAYVLAGEGWHPGVTGIVASRIAERHHRPCVMVALGPDGGRGSGRSIPAFDLHAGLAACSGHLRRFGGHRAAAGLELDPAELDAFRDAFVAHASATLSPEDLRPVEKVDAVVPATALGLPLAEELRRLEPFGEGNREPVLLVPGARVSGVRPMGEEAQHARFTLVTGAARAGAVAFRTPPRSLARAGEEPHDAAVRLEAREWMGTLEPRLVLSALCPSEAGSCRVAGEAAPFWDQLEGELERELPADLDRRAGCGLKQGDGESARIVCDRRGEGLVGVVGDLLSSGESVIVLCADVERRRRSLEQVLAGLARSGDEPGALTVAAWEAIEHSCSAVAPARHLLALDPPSSDEGLERAAAAGPGRLHLAWGAAEVEFALWVARAELDLRAMLAELYRDIRDRVHVAGDELETLLRGPPGTPGTPGTGGRERSPALGGRAIRVLTELELIEYRGTAEGAPACRVLDPTPTALDRSPAYRHYQRRLARAEAYLAGEAGRRPRSAPAAPAEATA